MEMISRGEPTQLSLRVGDAERDACVSALIDHHLHGRLSVEELDRRQRAALAAVTTRDLGLLLTDLPQENFPADPLPRSVVAPAPASDRVTGVAIRAIPAGVVLSGASFAQWVFWQYGAQSPFLGTLVGGALGYAACAATVRFRRR